MNEVAARTASSVMALAATLKQGLANVHSSLPATGGEPFMRLLRDGTWVYGADNVEVEPGSLWAINPMSLQHGWVCWTRWEDRGQPKKKNEIVGERMVPMTQPKPLLDTLPDTGDWNNEWTDQISFQLKCISGEDTGEQVLYKATSKGGIGEARELIAAIMKQLDLDPTKPVPVVVLGNDHYMHNQYGKTYVPKFSVQHFVSMDGDETEQPAQTAPQTATQPSAPTEPQAQAETTSRRSRAAPTAQAGQQTQAAPQTAQAAGQAEAPAGEPVRRRRRVS